MIVGLGNTLTDIGEDVNAGYYSNIPSTLTSGLVAGDGWAVMIGVATVWLVYKSFQGGKRVTQLPSELSRRRQARHNKKIDEDIDALEDLKRGGKKK